VRPDHGTNSRYVNQKCRCDECRSAHYAATAEHNKARAAAVRALVKRHPAELRLIYEAICAARGLSTKVGPPYAKGA